MGYEPSGPAIPAGMPGRAGLARRRLGVAAIYALLILGALIVFYPFLVMVMNSIKTAQEINHYPLHFPSRINTGGYAEVFRVLNITRLFGNTLFVACVALVLNVVLNAMGGYAIAKIDFPYRDLLFKVMLASYMVPGVLLLIPSYMMLYSWGWVDTYKPLILPGAVGAYNIFLVRQYMAHIHQDYLDAARIDGAGELRIFAQVVMPMARPVLTTIAILTFMGAWNDLFGPLLYLRDEKRFTLQLGLRFFQTSIPGLYVEQLYAGLVLATLPVVAVFLLLQNYFVTAFAGVGLKG